MGKPGSKKNLMPYWHPYQHDAKKQETLKNYLVKEYKEKIYHAL